MSLARKDNWLPAVFDDIFNQDWLSEIDRTQRIGKSVPAVNVKEAENNFAVEVAAPGMKKEDFSIELDNKMLTVSSETKEEHVSENEDEQFTRKEFSYTSFSRSFTLPESVDKSKISADYADGVLKIDLPKREEAKTEAKRRIEIQ